MNQKDHKAIAEILKKNRGKKTGTYTHFLHEELADYFEKEEREDVEKWKKEPNIKLDVLQLEITRLDNRRKQFLKDCGVEE